MSTLEKVKEKINSLSFDLKAEVILSILKETLHGEGHDFFINKAGQFKRPFRKDILDAEITDFDFDSTQYLKLNISRDSVYDTLPEGIFHQARRDKKNKSVFEMTEEYKAQKREQEFVNKFFQPFENEFFLFDIYREDLEKEMLFELNGTKPLEFFYSFWGLNKDIPEVLLAKFIRILPQVSRIVGDLEDTAECLKYLLNEEVELKDLGFKEQANTEETILLGECRLGLDMISGDIYMDYSVNMEFIIGPLKNSEFHEYIHDGKIKKFIDLFYEYFLPMEIDPKTTILLHPETEAFGFDKKPVLGLTTRI